ncbi:discoidin domain-containing receptor 2-like isoform X1 [Limulus polyphemus]|uniref:receptor protein-tyrosine kinase n=1 Tax=Limulus polyphemus TaxID=6850 RepID=A0ABM1SB28_LIMPO|nr:discoidin domain-containing receptor 2-like isoform X1 [Limulus polyphemus]XP_022240833.1 discoidin domain-containing receptor 2-like isoform X1 [Limulus polyphemus]XP_022240834.1 discoidin domain-containing receptor 2-like isoform X1 [Limulus polyphemus]XP_022240835.1 discoidin domain-containing receptor 2-like isoform X1 [Limulus polyphemus]XP_022240836.1 discoidin domain-containing receptor 2-like isoform X1 [Limulus polyphemus]XP_022240837.1 discoidin domain-containing receptor 2-like i
MWRLVDPSLIMRRLIMMLLLASSNLEFSLSLRTESCKTALGMKSGDIKDEDITASSSYNDAVGPRTARLEQEVNSGAWCPSRQIDKDTHEYLEINLYSLHVITQVATQGRFGNGQGQEYAEQYKLEYWRPGVHEWIRYRNRTGHEILQGNTNTYFPAKRKVDPLIIASKIRFVPHSILLRTVCMRVEVYGCPWTEGIISYSMPQGERRGLELDLSDNTYDGVKDDSYLNGGLGQLTDGIEGDNNFKADVHGHGKGYEWVGWKNDTSYSRPLEIVFAFDSVRNFSSLYFHCNNLYTKDVQVFSTARLWFSIGGKYYLDDPLRFSYMADTYSDKARNVTIFLHHRIGKFVKVELTFASRWILISEVSFSSVPAQGNFTEEEPPAAPPIVSTAMNDDSLSSQYVGLVIGVLAAVILLLIIVIFIIIARNRRRKHTTPHTMLKPVENRVTINMKDLGISYSPCSPVGRQANGNVYGQVALDDADPDKLLYQEPQDFKPFGGIYSNDSTTSREYAVPDVQKPSTPLCHPPPTPVNFPQTLVKPPHHPSEKHYAATDVVKLPNIQGVSGSTVYAVPNVELLNREEPPVREIPRHRLKFLEKLGEGQFGEVHLCEAEGIPELVDVPCYGNKTLVAVKTLRQNASEQARNDFYKEVKILSRLRDPNIVHVLGVCTREEPLGMIVEYMENGDLNQFLQQHIPEGAAYRSVNAKTLSYGSLIYMATQVASGMKYLELLNFVHRDLATRNCLVGRAYTIKVADFGMSRDLYTADYYRIEGRAMLPIRWMAWESILLGKFTTRTDVWSFAVTLWEILTFARQQPYSDLGDEQVIENVGHFYHNDGQHVLPSQPPNCPKEIYDLMRECWQRNDNDRPNFREIHLFLQRKNLGYSPQL